MVGTAQARLCPPYGFVCKSTSPRKRGEVKKSYVSILTYSKSPGLLSMPTLGGEIQEA